MASETIQPVNYDNDVECYQVKKQPVRVTKTVQKILSGIARILLAGTDYQIEKINMENIKSPYFIMSTHMSFNDFPISIMATEPDPVNHIATMVSYYRKPKIMELVGCICKRRFTQDLALIRSINHCIKKYGSVINMYPEARYSQAGVMSVVPDSIGKIVKMQKVPLVILKSCGNYLRNPYWNHRQINRKVPIRATMTCVLTEKEIKEKSAEEIYQIIIAALDYDEYQWQKDNKIKISHKKRATGLHKVLYQCPHCMAESRMKSHGIHVSCSACGKVWKLTEYGEMQALEGETEFSHIPDWFRWQRKQVREQIENGSYFFEDEVEIYSLPNPKRFISLGKGKIVHDRNGFRLNGMYRGKPFEICRLAKSMYGIHVEYNSLYVKPYDSIDLSTDHDTFYCYPKKENVVTKISLATEELFKWWEEQRLMEENNG